MSVADSRGSDQRCHTAMVLEMRFRLDTEKLRVTDCMVLSETWL